MTIHEMCDTRNPLACLNPLKVLVTLQGLSGGFRKTLEFPKNWSNELNEFLKECLEDYEKRKKPSEMTALPFISRNKHHKPSSLQKFFQSSTNTKNLPSKTEFDFNTFWDDKEEIKDSQQFLKQSYSEGVFVKDLISLITNGNSNTLLFENFADAIFIKDLLLEKYITLCYQLYFTAEELLDWLIKRYQGFKNQKNNEKVQRSVCRVLEHWVLGNCGELYGNLGYKLKKMMQHFPQSKQYMNKPAIDKIESLENGRILDHISIPINTVSCRFTYLFSIQKRHLNKI